MFVLKSTFNRALRDIASLKNLVDSYEALLFQSDPNWKRRFFGWQQMLVKTQSHGVIDAPDLKGKRLLVQTASSNTAILQFEGYMEIEVLDVEDNYFKFQFEARVKDGVKIKKAYWDRIDNYEIIQCLGLTKLELVKGKKNG